jgi:cell cycle checkpoint protein
MSDLHSTRFPADSVTGVVVLDRQLFNSFRFDAFPRQSQHPSQAQSQADDDEDTQLPLFAISLAALLETLQIFGFAETKEKWSTRSDNAYSSGIHGSRSGGGLGASTAFDARSLGMTGLCRLSYAGIGSPLCITLEENNVNTTCELMTYEPESIMGTSAEDAEDFEIPFDRNALTQKVIMRATLLHDAIAELATTTPERLTIVSSPKAPYFSLSAIGPLGSTTVDFNKDAVAAPQRDGAPGAQLLETFQVASQRVINTYRFETVRKAVKAMTVAEKVSIRTDSQGVLSLQFMVQLEGGHVTFVDFKFVPHVAEDEEDDDEEEEEDDEEGTQTQTHDDADM